MNQCRHLTTTGVHITLLQPLSCCPDIGSPQRFWTIGLIQLLKGDVSVSSPVNITKVEPPCSVRMASSLLSTAEGRIVMIGAIVHVIFAQIIV